MRLVARHLHTPPNQIALSALAMKLGADVPACLVSRTLFARGIGERIALVPGVPALPLVLACPPVTVATAAVFGALESSEGTPLPALPSRSASLADVAIWLREARNDLARPAMAVSREAGNAATALARDPECLFARMSGSGAAAFGLFSTRAAATRAARRLSSAEPGWWVKATTTVPS